MQPQTQTASGRLAGQYSRGVFCFLGIPYAAPPVGELRWRAPQPPVAWSGVRDATSFGPSCPQVVGAGFNHRTPAQSEDCLYLNVWTKTLDQAARQPVMVWIHGGGNLGGAGSEDAFDGATLASKGATVVTINYRLGAFGFLAHPDIGANFGVQDYVAALRWVRDNIGAFGGNPDNVLIFGESAGGFATRYLLQTPSARGLFHRAVLQSGGMDPPAFAPAWSYARAQGAAERLMDRFGSRDPDVLRKISTADLLQASHELSGIFPPAGQVHTPANLVWMPVVDNETLHEDDYDGAPFDVPVMFGCLENEARYFIKPSGTYTQEGVEIMARALCGAKANEVLALLEAGGGSAYDKLDRLFSTVIWFEPALETLRRYERQGRQVYYYHFARLSPGAIASNDLVKHSAEIRYVFGNLTDDGAYNADDARVSEIMQNAWLAFARTGAPATDGKTWPRFAKEAPMHAHIENAVTYRPFAPTPLIRAINSLRG